MAERVIVDEARRARLLELARKAWGDVVVDNVLVLVDGSAEVVTQAGFLKLSVDAHPRAVDALEAALLVLNGTRIHVMVPPTRGYVSWHVQDEPPAWVEQLAREWEQTAANWRDNHEHYEGEEECEPSCNAEAKQVERCAAELRKRATEG